MPFQKLMRWGLLLLFAVGFTQLYLFLLYQPGLMLSTVGAVGSFLLGALYLILEEKVFAVSARRRSLLNKVIRHSVACGLLVFTGLLLLYLLGGVALMEAAGSTDPADLEYTEWMYPDRLLLIFFWSLFSGIVLAIYNVMKESAGPRTLNHLLSGRFAVPKEEERLLLRIGLRNADGLRKSLGNERFFLLSNELFNTVAPMASKLNAEVRDQGEGYLEIMLHPRLLGKAADPESWEQLKIWSDTIGSDDASMSPSPYVYLSREQLTIAQVEGLRRQLIYLPSARVGGNLCQIPSVGLLFCQQKLLSELPSAWQGVEE